MANSSLTLRQFTKRLLRSDPPRSKSLIVTIFGDSLLPRVPEVWLAELASLLEPFCINGQLTRTSASRLAAEGWLQSRREGRSSRYGLTASGTERVQAAYRRIYDPPRQQWDGQWTILIPCKNAAVTTRKQLRTELEWAGFGSVVPRVFVHPRPEIHAMNEVLHRLGLADDVVVVRAKDLSKCSALPVAARAGECWNLNAVADHYTAFLRRFEPLAQLLGTEKPDPEAAFVVQTLLIHAFRRVVLHDPRLPHALLPGDWPGHAAYDLCRKVYLHTYGAVGDYLNSSLEQGQRGPLTTAPGFLNRFGGLR